MKVRQQMCTNTKYIPSALSVANKNKWYYMLKSENSTLGCFTAQ